MDEKKGSGNSSQKKKNCLKKFCFFLRKIWESVKPPVYTRKGAGWGIFTALIILTVFYGIYIRPGFNGFLNPISGALILFIIVSLVFLIVLLLIKILSVLPVFLTRAGVISLIILIIFFVQFGFPFLPSLLAGLILGLAFAFVGGGLASVFHEDFKFGRLFKKILTFAAILIPLIIIVYMGYWLFIYKGGTNHLTVFKPDWEKVRSLDAENPSRPGSYDFRTLTYGSGDHKRRPEFADQVFLKTYSVDATPFVKENNGGADNCFALVLAYPAVVINV